MVKGCYALRPRLVCYGYEVLAIAYAAIIAQLHYACFAYHSAQGIGYRNKRTLGAAGHLEV
jgi:hypothetical protein